MNIKVDEVTITFKRDELLAFLSVAGKISEGEYKQNLEEDEENNYETFNEIFNELYFNIMQFNKFERKRGR